MRLRSRCEMITTKSWPRRTSFSWACCVSRGLQDRFGSMPLIQAIANIARLLLCETLRVSQNSVPFLKIPIGVQRARIEWILTVYLAAGLLVFILIMSVRMPRRAVGDRRYYSSMRRWVGTSEILYCDTAAVRHCEEGRVRLVRNLQKAGSRAEGQVSRGVRARSLAAPL